MRSVALGGVLALAIALRLWGLGFQSLWHDELFVWHAVREGGLARAVEVGAAQDVHPPGYTVLIYFWQFLFGDSEIALRLPSAIAGVVAVVWIARLGEAWFDRRTGLVVATLTATSWMAIYYSQEGRPYELLFLGTIFLAERLTAFEGMSPHDSGRRRAWVWIQWAIASLFLSYLHYFGLLITACFLLVWAAIGRARWAPVTMGAVVAVGYLPWISVLRDQVTQGEVWIPPSSPERVYEVFMAMTNGAFPGFVALTIVGAFCATWDEGSVRTLALLLGWIILPMGIALGISSWVLPVVTDRNLIVVLPAVLLVAAWAATQIDRKWFAGRPLFAAAIVLMLLTDLFVVRDYYRRPTKSQYRGVADIVASQGDDPFFVSGAWHPDYFDYYFRQQGVPHRVGATAKRPRQLRNVLPTPSPAVLFVAVPRTGRGAIADAMQNTATRLDGFDLTESWSFVGWDLHRLDHH